MNSPAKKPTPGTFVIDGKTSISVAPGEDEPTHLAANFLTQDIEAITGKKPKIPTALPEASQRSIFIVSADNPKARETLNSLQVDTSEIAGKWEAYLFHTARNALVICGSDALATMRGVYGLCRTALGVDPLYRWTGLRPARRKKISLEGINRTVDSPTFKFRGWFLNAGHLIHWNMGHGPEVDLRRKYGAKGAQYGISGSFGREMGEMILEAALRSDMNMIIPLSYLDLDDPDEKAVADLCREFGIFLSHHHQEPLGANLRVWDTFWKSRGEPVPEMSFYKNPEKFKAWWRHYAQLWAKYPRVVYVIGHRGPGDRPFWLKDDFCPDTGEARGKVISEAMEMQLGLLKEVCRDRPIHYTATLWQEGSPLHASGALRFPPGTMVVMADQGSKQLMREDFYQNPRHKELTYGVYYHVCYGPGGPLWAQGNSPDRMWYALTQVIKKGDTALALLNVGNIRPYFPGLAAWSHLTTHHQDFEPEAFLGNWCREKFGCEHAEEIVECYNAFFASFITPYYPMYDGHRGLWDGVLNNESWRMLQLINTGDLPAAYRRIGRPFPDAEVFVRFHKNKTAAVLGTWDALCKKAHAISRKLSGPARNLFEDNMVVQCEIVRALYYITHFIARAGLALLSGETKEAIEHLTQARSRAEAGAKYCVKSGNRGVFKGWFTMHRAFGMDYLRLLDLVCEKLAGKAPESEEDHKYLQRTLALPRRE